MEKKSRSKYISAWQAENSDRLVVRAKKSLNLPDRIAAQVEKGRAKSRQDFIIQAVLKVLEECEKED